MYRLNNIGPLPWGTPLWIGNASDVLCPTTILAVLSLRKDLIISQVGPSTPALRSLKSRSSAQILSNAFFTSNSATAVNCPSSCPPICALLGIQTGSLGWLFPSVLRSISSALSAPEVSLGLNDLEDLSRCGEESAVLNRRR